MVIIFISSLNWTPQGNPVLNFCTLSAKTQACGNQPRVTSQLALLLLPCEISEVLRLPQRVEGPTSFHLCRKLRGTFMVDILTTLAYLSGEKSNLNISNSKKWTHSTPLPNANILRLHFCQRSLAGIRFACQWNLRKEEKRKKKELIIYEER